VSGRPLQRRVGSRGLASILSLSSDTLSRQSNHHMPKQLRIRAVEFETRWVATAATIQTHLHLRDHTYKYMGTSQ